MKKIMLMILLVSVVFVMGCTKTYSQIEKDTGIRFEEIPMNYPPIKGDCRLVCPDGTPVFCGEKCPTTIEERLSDEAKKSCGDSGGNIVLKEKNEICECPPSSIEGAENRFSPVYGCNPVCGRGFQIIGNECVEISAKELCESRSSGGTWRTDLVFIQEPTQDEKDRASCQCPLGSVGYTPHFGCDYVVELKSLETFSTYYVG